MHVEHANRPKAVDHAMSQMHLDARDVQVHMGERGRRAGAFGARGVADGRTVYVAPGLGAAEALVLVHELAHVVQARNRTQSARVARTMDPELEARSLAEAFREGRPLWRPVAVLAAGVIAADRGAVGVIPKPSAAESVRPTAPESPEKDDPTLAQIELREAELGKVVEDRYKVERERMIDYLDGLWVDGDDVRGCLRILDGMPYVVAKALVRSLPSKRRIDFVTSIADEDHRTYPAAAVAALAALAVNHPSRIEVANLLGLDARGFADEPLRGAHTVLRSVRHDVLTELVKSERGAYFKSLLMGPPPPGTDAAAIAKAKAEIEKEKKDLDER